MKIISKSEKETFAFAKNFAKNLRGGEVLALTGNLGAGKTVFTKGLAAGLGIKKNITSPTFVLMKIYPVKIKSKIKNLCHIDAYRVNSHKDLIAIGAEDYINNPETVTVIEWAEKIKKLLTKNIKNVTMKYLNHKDKNRIIIIK